MRVASFDRLGSLGHTMGHSTNDGLSSMSDTSNNNLGRVDISLLGSHEVLLFLAIVAVVAICKVVLILVLLRVLEWMVIVFPVLWTVRGRRRRDTTGGLMTPGGRLVVAIVIVAVVVAHGLLLVILGAAR